MTARKRRRKLRVGRLLTVLALGFACIVLLAGLGLFFISLRDLPSFDTAALSTANATTVYDRENKPVGTIGVENRVPVKIKDIPERVQQAFLAAEDHRFYEHHGVDFIGIFRAAITDLLGRGLHQGASTITQQLVKQSFLTPEKTFKRKIQEVILAVQLERHYTKPEILEMYLNKIYFGEGAYGIQSAARLYFNKDAAKLSLPEAALLAGVIRAPSYYSPYQNPEAAKKRRDLILDNMSRYGFITAREAEEAKKSKLDLATGTPENRKYPYPYFIDYITSLLVDKYGSDMVYKGGLRVYTTLDTRIQKIAEEVLANSKNYPPVKDVQGAMVVLDARKGYILAMVGGREHKGRLAWNRAVRPPGQPGSAFKPIIAYAPAIELKGMGPASVVDDIPVNYNGYQPQNSDRKYRGLITLRTALTHSVNVVAVKLVMDSVGLNQAIDFAGRFGFKIDPARTGASIALGTWEVSPLELASAYTAFANEGIQSRPLAILRVEDSSGNILEEYRPQQKQVISPSTAFLVTDMLRSVVENGTGQNARLARPVAGKTGTTEKGTDLWFAGYTPQMVGVVWVGTENNRSMPRAYGGTYPAAIWRQVMARALQNVPTQDFSRPADITTATVDSKSGLLPGPNTPPEHQITDYFAAGTVPTEIDNTHVPVEVCATSGLLPTANCPERVVRNLVKLPYEVPDFVLDYLERVPTKTCPVHNPASGGFLPPEQNAGQVPSEGGFIP